MKKIYIIFILNFFTLAGCVGNTPSNDVQQPATVNNTEASKSVSHSADLNAIPFSDFNVTTSGQCSYTQCSADNSVCARLTACVGAQYASGLGGNNYWVTQEQAISGGTLKLTFNQTNISSDFHLSDIYNDLHNSGVVGQIEQIDMNECNTLVAKGANSGDTCNIDFVYYGLSFTQSNTTNDIHLDFKSSKESEQLNFSFPVANNYLTNQNIPIMDTPSGQIINYSINSLSEINAGDRYDLYYSPDFSLSLTNNGMATLYTINKEPDIKAVLGKRMNVVTSPLYYSYSTSSITSCGSNPVDRMDTCLFGYNNPNLLSAPTVNSEFRRFGFMYTNNQTTRNITNTRFNVLGVGDIVSENHQLTAGEAESNNFKLKVRKQSYGNSALSYDIPLQNMKLRAVYNPVFPISTYTMNDNLYYAYGDYANYSLNNIIANIKLDYDPNCFSGGFDITHESQELKYNDCPVTITLKNSFMKSGTYNKSYKPIEFLLYANYDSPIGKNIDQLVGAVTISKAPIVPSGSYKTAFESMVLADGVLSANFTGGGLPYWDSNMSKLQYDTVCEAFSKVNYFVTDEGNPRSPSSTDPSVRYHHGYLTCDKLNSQFPQGDYKNSCTELYLDDGVLHGKCLGKIRFGGINDYTIKPLTTSLDYLHQCKAGATIQNNNGKLEC